MDTTNFLIFLMVSFGLIVVPGPNVLVIVSTSLLHGRKQGLQTVAGTSAAMAIQLMVVAISTAWLVQLISDGLLYLKWIGAAVLFSLGVFHVKKAMSSNKKKMDVSITATFLNGFLVSLTNPKTLLFFSAFLPQFVTSSESYKIQIAILSFVFLSMAIVLDCCYALLSSKFILLAKTRYRSLLEHGIGGLLYLVASTWLVLTNRSS